MTPPGNIPNVTHSESPKSREETPEETDNHLSVSLLSVPPLVVPPLNLEYPEEIRLIMCKSF